MAINGIVVEGDKRGRELGFPTANIEIAANDMPDDGVYGGWVRLADGSVHAAAVSVGTRPTYYGRDGERLVEAYLLGFDGDLYGQELTLSLEVHVRGQVGFPDSEALIRQIAADVAAVESLAADGRLGLP